jgi:hypothetical protein
MMNLGGCETKLSWTVGNGNKQSKIRGATGSDEPWPAEQPPLAVFQHIESHSCIFSFPNRTVTSLFK